MIEIYILEPEESPSGKSCPSLQGPLNESKDAIEPLEYNNELTQSTFSILLYK